MLLVSSGEQATDHDGGKSGEADQQQLNERESLRKPAPALRRALTGTGKAEVKKPNVV